MLNVLHAMANRASLQELRTMSRSKLGSNIATTICSIRMEYADLTPDGRGDFHHQLKY